MKKIIFISLFFSLSLLAGTSDNINLSSTIDPVCEVTFDAEPIASNLDITISQTNLKVGSAHFNDNTRESSSFYSTLTIETTNNLINENLSSSYFYFNELSVFGSQDTSATTIPFGIVGPLPYDREAVIFLDFLLTYTGVPALSLVQGTYSAEWFVSCSIEPRT